jgi:hypothetical protein
MRELLDVQGAAAYVHLAPQTLNKKRCVGDSPEFIKVGSRVFYERSALDAWLDERRRTSTTDNGTRKPSTKRQRV